MYINIWYIRTLTINFIIFGPLFEKLPIDRSICYLYFMKYKNLHGVSTDSHRHLFHSKNICPPPLPWFKVNICPLPLPHFASIFFAYLWSFRWPNYIVTLPRYFSFRLPHLNISTGTPSDELDKTIQRKWLGWKFKSLKRIQPLPVCAGFFICIRISLDRPCVTMSSWSSPLKCKVSL
jgi:hypothetical protein